MNIKNYINGNFDNSVNSFRKYCYFLFFIFLCSSYENLQKKILSIEVDEAIIEKPVITDEFKLAFLNEILNNKEDQYLYPYGYKKPHLIFYSFEYKGNKDVAYIGALVKPSTLPEFVNQLKNNESLDVYKLSNYGFNIVD